MGAAGHSSNQYGVLKFSPTAKSPSIYSTSWSVGVGHRHVRGASTCSGVAAKLLPGPQPEVFSVSIGLGCGFSPPSTMFLQLKSKSASLAAAPRILHSEHLHGDQHGDHEHSHHHHYEHNHEHSHDQLLL